MTLLVTGKFNYRSRIERAALLGERLSFAQQTLGFYGRVAKFQKEFYEQLPKLWEGCRLRQRVAIFVRN